MFNHRCICAAGFLGTSLIHYLMYPPEELGMLCFILFPEGGATGGGCKGLKLKCKWLMMFVCFLWALITLIPVLNRYHE